VKPRAPRKHSAVAVFLTCLLGCSRDDLYAITLEAAPQGGGSAGNASAGSANAGSAGNANAGGGNAGGGKAGSGNAGSAGNTNAGGAGSGNGGSAGMAGGSSGNGALAACKSAVIVPGDTSRTIVVGGVTRSYVLHVPSSYDGNEQVPLVLDFHAVGGSGMTERTSSPYPAVLDPEGVIMAFPDGLKGPAGTAWNVGPCCVADVDDVAFARALVQEVRGLGCVDPKRVYAVGVLTGGGMAHYLACEAADVFAAVAPAAFDLLAENVDECQPQRPVTVISFRGTADVRVPYEGGASSLVPGMPLTFLGAQATLDKWAAIDACPGTASPPDGAGCSAYTSCNGGTEVVLCTQQGGGEDPGDPSVAWPVLARHTL
jgi:polyhydroxybutyrate depolymerase